MRLYFLLTTLQLNICLCQSDGLLLVSNRDTYQNIFTALVTNDYQIYHQWSHPTSVHSVAYFQDDSTLIVPLVIENPIMPVVNKPGGRFQKLNWNNEVIWDFDFYDSLYTPHHDIEPLPNGNILAICWEVKTMQEAIDMGRQNISSSLWPTMIVELSPPSGSVVWEWHIWDHLIQDIDPSLSNYGNVSNHPELLDINLGGPVDNINGDWLHVNAIDYNEELEQIIFSSRHMNEIYVIDHSTTTEEAASHLGGNSGKGGDILYRWGNPMNYGRGTIDDIKIIAPHDAHWIKQNHPGGGNILIFNNNPDQFNMGNSSEVIEIIPPIGPSGNYFINEDDPFGPETIHWSHGGDSSFFSGWQSGAERLENGNTLITVAQQRYIFEVDSDNNILWQCHTGGNLGWIDYPLRSTKIESELFVSTLNHQLISDNFQLNQNYPNPFNPVTHISYNANDKNFNRIFIYDINGKFIRSLKSQRKSRETFSAKWNGTDQLGKLVSAGIYIYTVGEGQAMIRKKMTLLK